MLAAGKTATGIEIPDDVISALGHGRKPPVRVTINGFTYRSTVAVMGGTCMVGISAENRAATGASAGDEIDIHLEVDTSPRDIALPDDFAAALGEAPTAAEFFERLSSSNKRWHITNVQGAKTPETRARRIAKSVEALSQGQAR